MFSISSCVMFSIDIFIPTAFAPFQKESVNKKRNWRFLSRGRSGFPLPETLKATI
jgi:hypothetical protein